MKKKGDYLERKIAAMKALAEAWQDRVSGALVILLLAIQPLYINAHRYILLTRRKFVFFAICMCCLLFASLIIWIYRFSRKPRLMPRGKLSVVDWAVLGFAAFTILSAVASPFKSGIGIDSDSVKYARGFFSPLFIELKNGDGSVTRPLANVWFGIPERFDGLITQIFYVAVFFIVSRWYKPRKRDFIIFSVAAILIGLIGILQFYGFDFLKLWPNDRPDLHVENYYSIYFRSTLGNVDIVSTYVCMAVLLCGFMYVKSMSSKWRFMFLAGSASCFWLMDLANANSGRIGVAVATVLSIPFIIENRRTIGKFLVLGSSWLATLALQRLFFNVSILKDATLGSLLPYAGAFVLLLAVGAFLALWRNASPQERSSEKEATPSADVGSGLMDKEADAISDAGSGTTRSGERFRWKIGVALIVVCIAIGIGGIEALGKRIADSDAPRTKVDKIVYELRELLHGNIRDEFATNRGYIWRTALAVVPEHPILGTGPDTFDKALHQELPLKYGEAYDKAHNEYLQILICQGILGLLCYLVFIVETARRSIVDAIKDPMLMAVLATYIGYCVQAFFNINLPIASQMLWILAGILCAIRREKLEPAAQVETALR